MKGNLDTTLFRSVQQNYQLRMGESAFRSHVVGSKQQANIKSDGSTTGQRTMKLFVQGKGSEGLISAPLAFKVAPKMTIVEALRKIP